MVVGNTLITQYFHFEKLGSKSFSGSQVTRHADVCMLKKLRNVKVG